MTFDVTWAAALTLGLFVVLSFYDGVIVHLVIERLPLRPASRVEHLLHSARAVLFPGILVTFFAGSGPPLIGWGLLAADQLAEIGDMLVERRSRVHTGGLPTGEYVVHGTLVTLRSLAIAFTAVVHATGAPLQPLNTLVALLLPGALVVALAHVALAAWPRGFVRWSPEARA